MLYVLLFGRWLLPERQSVFPHYENVRTYAVETRIEANGPLPGKTVAGAGLRHLPGLYLAEIEREGHIVPAVSPEEVLRADDRLLFVGAVGSVADLQRVRGLVPAPEQVAKLGVHRPARLLVEAVVSDSSPVVGRSVREGRFRTRYGAVILAVARGSERLPGKVGDLVLQPGDTLLLEAHPSFAQTWRSSRDFYLVSGVPGSSPLRFGRAPVALGILVGMVAVVAVGWLSMLEASLVAAGLMLVARCVTGGVARRSVNWQVLIVIAASFGLGRALEVTGAAESIALNLVQFAGNDALLSLAIIYGVTMIFTELITNNGAAVLMFPIALATASSLGADVTPFAVAIMMAASASFATPIGYQTNLMVYGPGGYRFSDYLKIGVPLNLLIGAVTVLVVPQVWPFQASI